MPPMGVRFSPSLANLYMAWREEEVIYSDNNPYSIQWYKHYIDNILPVRSGNTASIQDLVDYLNTNNLNLRFTHMTNAGSIFFLDLQLVRGLIHQK